MRLVCIVCPRGCYMDVHKTEEGKWKIAGNGCKRGKLYALQEVTCPLRTLTTSVPVEGGDYRMLSVRTDKPIPANKIFQALEEIANIKARAPVRIGDVLLFNVAGTGANVIATRRIERKEECHG